MSRADQRRRYKAKHPEKVREWARSYRERNKEKIAESRRAYRQAHRKEIQMQENDRRRVNRENNRREWLILPGTEEFTPEVQKNRAIQVTTCRPRFEEIETLDEAILSFYRGEKAGVLVGRGIDQAVAQYAHLHFRQHQKEELATQGTASFHLGFSTFKLEYAPGCFVRITRTKGGQRRERVTWWEVGWMGGEARPEGSMRFSQAEMVDHDLALMGTRLRSWHSPAAVASVWMRERGVKEHLSPCPPEVEEAARCAYFGGDIRCFRVGVFGEPVQKFDLNSAYAWALAQMPSFQGQWIRAEEGCSWSSLWRVSWDLHPKDADFLYPVTPFPWRDERGLVSYPRRGQGWHWGPLVFQARGHWGDRVTLHEGWEFRPDFTYRPFAWLEDIYRYRQKCGEPLAGILKTAMSAVYGKLVQEGDRWPNPYQHIAAAGLCTSLVRARMLSFAAAHPERVVSALTDCLWLKGPRTGAGGSCTALGAWRHTPLDGFASFSPNFYLEKQAEGWEEHAAGVSRIPHDGLNLLMALEHRKIQAERRVLWTPALCHEQNRWEMLGQVETQPVALSLRPQGGFQDQDDRSATPCWNNYDPCRDEEYRTVPSAPYRKLGK